MSSEKGADRIRTNEFKEMLSELGFTEESLAVKIAVQTLVRRWEDIIGPIYANQTEPFAIQDRTLVIITSHSAYKQEILFLKNRILSFCKKHLGQDLVRKIEVRVGNLSHKNKKTEAPSSHKTGFEGKQDLVSLAEKETDPIAKRRLLELIEYL